MKIPNHYKGLFKGILVKDVCDDFLLTYHLGSCCKYICRAGKKAGNPKANDIRKAIHHLQFELELLEKQNENNTPSTKPPASCCL